MRFDTRNSHQLVLSANAASTSLRPVIAQGERGEQGLPGNASAAWTALTAVTTGTVRQAPDGSWIKSAASRTTRATFDATEQGFWTATLATAGTLEADALADSIDGTLDAQLPDRVADVLAEDPTILADAAALAASGVGTLTAGKAVELARNRMVDPQGKNNVVTSSSPSAFAVSQITSGLPAGFSYGQKSIRGTVSGSTTIADCYWGGTGAGPYLVPVTPGEPISVGAFLWTNDPATGSTGPTARVFARFLKADYSFLSNGDPTSNTAIAASTWAWRAAQNITVPATAAYVVVVGRVAAGAGGLATLGSESRMTGVMVVSGATLAQADYGDGTTPLWAWLTTAYASPSVKIYRAKSETDAMLAEVGKADAVAANIYTSVLTGKNLYNSADANVLNDTAMSGATPTYSASVGYRVTGWIPVTPGTTYYAGAHRHHMWADASLAKVGSVTNTGSNSFAGPYTAPVGAAYMRFDFNYASFPNFQVEVGAAATTYEAYVQYADLTAKMKAGIARAAATANPDPVSVVVASGATSLTVTSKVGTKDLTTLVSTNGSDNGAVRLVSTTYDGATISAHIDDICPIRTQLGTVGGNHGYVAGLYVAPNPDGKTAADLGSTWQDTAGREYVLVGFTVETTPRLYLLGSYTGGTGGTPVAAVATAPTTDLTHKANATHTGTIPFGTIIVGGASSSLTQLRPSTARLTVTAWLDGKPLTADGTYTGKVLEIREAYEILDYKSIYDLAKANVGTSYATLNPEGAVLVTNIFRWNGSGRTRVITTYDELKPTTLAECGAVQAIKLTLGGYTTTRYVPGMGTVGGLDWSAGVDYTSYATTNLLPASSERVAGRVSAFHMDTLSAAGTVLVGFAMGYLPFGTQSDTSSRSAARLTRAAASLWDMRDTTKCYPHFTAGEAAGWGHLQVDAYRDYLSPAQVASVLACKTDALASYAALNAAAAVAA